jgi:hypothetical protein
LILRRMKGSDRVANYLLFGGELLVKIVEVKTWRRQILDARQEGGCLELGHGSFELRRNEREGFMFDSKRFVEVDGFRD